MTTKKTAGFTLLELLVVVAVIGLLAGLLLPALAQAKAKTQRIACLSNLKQWSLAMHLYLDTYEEFLPRENAADGINSWFLASISTNGDVWYNALPRLINQPAVADFATAPADPMGFYARNVFHCPSAKLSAQAATYPNFSLAMNSKLISRITFAVRENSIREPARTPFFFDSGVPDEKPAHPRQSPYNGQPHAYASRYSARHGGSGNLVMADGHTETLPADRVVEMNTNSPVCGKSIFPPTAVIWCADPALNPN